MEWFFYLFLESFRKTSAREVVFVCDLEKPMQFFFKFSSHEVGNSSQFNADPLVIFTFRWLPTEVK